MASIDRSPEIIKDLESRLSSTQAELEWYKQRLNEKDEDKIDKLIDLMDHSYFRSWFNETLIRENSDFGDAVEDIATDVADYSTSFKDRIIEIIQDEVQQEIKDMIVDEMEYQVNTMSQDMVEFVVAKQLKKLKVVIDAEP